MDYVEILIAVTEGLARLDKAISDRMAEIERLEAEGISNAKEHWRKGKKKDYLYLIYPQRNGKRTREYIGANPAKIAEAQKKLANYKRFDEAQAEKADMERQMHYAVQELENARRIVAPRGAE